MPKNTVASALTAQTSVQQAACADEVLSEPQTERGTADRTVRQIELLPATAHTNTLDGISYEVLEQGSYGAQFGTAVIENQNDLNKLYELLHGSAAAAPPPKIDFKKKKVIAVCVGPFNTGGYGIKLYFAKDTKDCLETVFAITAPEPGQIVTQAFTTPYLIISIDAAPSKRISITMQRGEAEFDL